MNEFTTIEIRKFKSLLIPNYHIYYLLLIVIGWT